MAAQSRTDTQPVTTEGSFLPRKKSSEALGAMHGYSSDIGIPENFAELADSAKGGPSTAILLFQQ